MHVVNAAVLDEWTILPDKAVVSHVLDGRVARLLVQSRRCPESRSSPSSPERCDHVVAAVLARIA
jgi:hypothetical protein